MLSHLKTWIKSWAWEWQKEFVPLGFKM